MHKVEREANMEFPNEVVGSTRVVPVVSIEDINEQIKNQGFSGASVYTVNRQHLRQGVADYFAQKPESRELVGFPLTGDNGYFDKCAKADCPVFVGLPILEAMVLENWLAGQESGNGLSISRYRKHILKRR